MGLTSAGYEPKSLLQIREDIASGLRVKLGSDIDTSASSRIGQFIDVVSSEIHLIYLGQQDVYGSFFPDLSSGVSLDNVVAITNTTRLFPNGSTSEVYVSGDVGTVIPVASLMQKTGTDENFFTAEEVTIQSSSNMISIDDTPDDGSILLAWQGDVISAINWNDDEASIKSKIEGHTDISEVNITGRLNTVGAVHIEFVNESLASTEMTITSETLTRLGVALEGTPGFSASPSTPVIAVNTGEITVPVRSLTTIVTSALGWDKVFNFTVGTTGRDQENDGQLRDRRAEELQQEGVGTVSGMRQSIEGVANVISATVIQNDTSVIDSVGRPPVSFEAYVSGGDDDAVAQAIYDAKSIGVGIVTTAAATRTGAITDVNGEVKNLTFSEPSIIPMEIVVNITVNSFYPDDGADLIKAELESFFSDFSLGQDVLNHDLFTPVNRITGILTLEILQSTVVLGTPSASNTVMASEQIASLDAGDIIVVVS